MPAGQYPDLDPFDHITPRQRQILIHLVRGKARDAIAEELSLSRSTVNRDIRDIRDIRDMTLTLGTPSAEALGALAYQAGFLSGEHLRAVSSGTDPDGLGPPPRIA